jgi:hypothetical protein
MTPALVDRIATWLDDRTQDPTDRTQHRTQHPTDPTKGRR